MATNTELTLLSIYNRIVPKIQIADLVAKVDFTRRNDGSEYASGIEIASDYVRISVVLSLHNIDNDGIINNYRWEYKNRRTGTIIESVLDYKAPDEDVIAFFEHTLKTDESVRAL